MSSRVIAWSKLDIGTPTVIEAASPAEPFVAVFEDDHDTGYFYAVDPRLGADPILDALHVYDVKTVATEARLAELEILWSVDGLRSAVKINGQFQAVFDFVGREGVCRTGFPPAGPSESQWSRNGHNWRDEVLSWF